MYFRCQLIAAELNRRGNKYEIQLTKARYCEVRLTNESIDANSHR